MRHGNSFSSGFVRLVAGVLTGLLAWPVIGAAQSLGGVTGTVTGITNPLLSTATSTLLGATSVLDGTGTLFAGTSDALQASDLASGVAGLVTGEVLHAVTIGYPDQIDSEASLAALSLSPAGSSISADFIMARASAATATGTSAVSDIENLSINGVPINVSGAPNQQIPIPGGVVVLNEQQILSDGTMVVNALHAIVTGIADVAVASAMAGYSGGAAQAVRASY